jgi:hypothetical protein
MGYISNPILIRLSSIYKPGFPKMFFWRTEKGDSMKETGKTAFRIRRMTGVPQTDLPTKINIINAMIEPF